MEKGHSFLQNLPGFKNLVGLDKMGKDFSEKP